MLKGKTALVTGSTSGIGLGIATALAGRGANIVLNGFGDAAEIEKLRTKLAADHGVKVRYDGADLSQQDAIESMMGNAIEAFGGIDILVNNASALSITGTLTTSVKRYDLMNQINVRGTFICSQACIPYLSKSDNPHILTLSPPLNMSQKWFKEHVAYTIAKYGMSMCTLGMSAEFADQGIAVNSLWPRTPIATAAVEFFFPQALAGSRKSAIMADAAHAIVVRDSRSFTGHFFIDEEVLRAQGVTDFEQYALRPGANLFTDIFLD
jgi:citronellol/citronellal dehydrogenase